VFVGCCEYLKMVMELYYATASVLLSGLILFQPSSLLSIAGLNGRRYHFVMSILGVNLPPSV